MNSIISKLSCLAIVFGCGACAATADPRSAPATFIVVDRSKQLSLFTDDTIVGKYGFFAVRDFDADFTFSCGERVYKVAVESLNHGQRFNSSVSSIRYDDATLNSRKLKIINAGIHNIDIVGPVGLKCSAVGAVGNPVRLILRGGYVEAGNYHYEFKNHTFVLSDNDFESEKLK